MEALLKADKDSDEKSSLHEQGTIADLIRPQIKYHSSPNAKSTAENKASPMHPLHQNGLSGIPYSLSHRGVPKPNSGTYHTRLRDSMGTPLSVVGGAPSFTDATPKDMTIVGGSPSFLEGTPSLLGGSPSFLVGGTPSFGGKDASTGEGGTPNGGVDVDAVLAGSECSSMRMQPAEGRHGSQRACRQQRQCVSVRDVHGDPSCRQSQHAHVWLDDVKIQLQNARGDDDALSACRTRDRDASDAHIFDVVDGIKGHVHADGLHSEHVRVAAHRACGDAGLQSQEANMWPHQVTRELSVEGTHTNGGAARDSDSLTGSTNVDQITMQACSNRAHAYDAARTNSRENMAQECRGNHGANTAPACQHVARVDGLHKACVEEEGSRTHVHAHHGRVMAPSARQSELGQTDSQTHGRTDSQTHGRTDNQTHGRTDNLTECARRAIATLVPMEVEDGMLQAQRSTLKASSGRAVVKITGQDSSGVAVPGSTPARQLQFDCVDMQRAVNGTSHADSESTSMESCPPSHSDVHACAEACNTHPQPPCSFESANACARTQESYDDSPSKKFLDLCSVQDESAGCMNTGVVQEAGGLRGSQYVVSEHGI
jgi:hypothetical protein